MMAIVHGGRSKGAVAIELERVCCFAEIAWLAVTMRGKLGKTEA
jgi:hypothetical protein